MCRGVVGKPTGRGRRGSGGGAHAGHRIARRPDSAPVEAMSVLSPRRPIRLSSAPGSLPGTTGTPEPFVAGASGHPLRNARERGHAPTDPVETVRPKYAASWSAFHRSMSGAAPIDDVLAGRPRFTRELETRMRRRARSSMLAPSTDMAGLRALKGVGTYIAGAVGSIAWGYLSGRGWEPRAGACRVCSSGGRPQMTQVAEVLIQGCPERAGDLNQALMDRGSSICSPRKPRCGECPSRLSVWRRPAGPHRMARKVRKAPLRSAVAGVSQRFVGFCGAPSALRLVWRSVRAARSAASQDQSGQAGPGRPASAWLDRVGNDVERRCAWGVVHAYTHAPHASIRGFGRGP